MATPSQSKTIKDKTGRNTAKILFALILIGVFLARMPWINSDLVFDEIELISASEAIATRGDVIYDVGDIDGGNNTVPHPPLYMVTLASIYTVLGQDVAVTGYRAFMLILGILSIVIIWPLSRTLFNRDHGLIAVLAAVLLSINRLHLVTSLTILDDMLVTVLILATITVYLRRSSRNWVLVGLFLGLAFLTKIGPAVILLLTLITATILRIWRENGKNEEKVDRWKEEVIHLAKIMILASILFVSIMALAQYVFGGELRRKCD